jgi:hypothetical protein
MSGRFIDVRDSVLTPPATARTQTIIPREGDGSGGVLDG